MPLIQDSWTGQHLPPARLSNIDTSTLLCLFRLWCAPSNPAIMAQQLSDEQGAFERSGVLLRLQLSCRGLPWRGKPYQSTFLLLFASF